MKEQLRDMGVRGKKEEEKDLIHVISKRKIKERIKKLPRTEIHFSISISTAAHKYT